MSLNSVSLTLGMQRFLGVAEDLGDNKVGVTAVTSGVKLDGHEWIPAGVDLSGFKRNPVVLRDHRPEAIVGACTAIGLVDDEVQAVIEFVPPGTSAVADETRILAKTGFLRGVSAGIDPIEIEPLNPRDPYGGQRVLRSRLLEISFVAIPADGAARVTQRSDATRRDYRKVWLRHAIAPTTVARTFELARPSQGALSETVQAWLLHEAERDRRYTVEARRAGKMLSAANHERIHAAHDLVEAGRSLLRGVLDAAELDCDDDDAADRAARLRALEALSRDPIAADAYYRRRVAAALALGSPELVLEIGDADFERRQAEMRRLARGGR